MKLTLKALNYTERMIRIYNHSVLGFILTVAAIFCIPTFHAIKESAESSTLVSQQALSAVGSATSLIGDSTRKKDGTLFGMVSKLEQLVDKIAGVADAGKNTLDASTKLLTSSTTLVSTANQALLDAKEPLSQTQQRIDKLLDAYSTVPTFVNPLMASSTHAMDNLAKTINTTNDLLGDPKTGAMRDSMTYFFTNTGDLTKSWAVLSTNVNNKLFAKWDGSHPYKHHFGQIGKFSLGLVEPGYYAKGLFTK